MELELAEACGLWPRWRPWLRGVPKAVLQVGEATESCQIAQQTR